MLIPTECPIDGTDKFDEEIYPANFALDDLTADRFSARRSPDQIHYRMVRNTKSGCVRANPILDPSIVHALYRDSHATNADIIPYTLATYLRYADRLWAHLPDKRGVLEIGCGSGSFVESMKRLGFEHIIGVEPSREAAAQAPVDVQPYIQSVAFEEIVLPASSFSLIAGFQVLDHLIHPNEVLRKCRDALCRGGLMYWICHDIGSMFACLLGKRCPMIDIQHVILYDKSTIATLFRNNGFNVLDIFGVVNRYPLRYWLKLSPLPQMMKGTFTAHLIETTGIGRIPISANLGNMGIIAQKP